MALKTAVACAVVATAAGKLSDAPQINMMPTIGILTMPLADAESACSTVAMKGGVPLREDFPVSCFSAFYSRWLWSAGSRAIILPYDLATSNQTEFDLLLDSLNGVLFTGGGLETLYWNNSYMMAAQRVYDTVLKKNDDGVFLPLHGTCQGMQVLSLLTSHNQSVLVEYAYDSENYSVPLDFTASGLTQGRMFATAPSNIQSILEEEDVTLNLHHDGVPPEYFLQNPSLTSFYNLVSTNLDRQNKSFVSTLEAFDYPITATQWHPERPQFEWRTGMNINHSADAVSAMQYVANFFVSDARRNNQSFDANPDLLERYSVYSYPVAGAPDQATSGYQYYIVQL